MRSPGSCCWTVTISWSKAWTTCPSAATTTSPGLSPAFAAGPPAAAPPASPRLEPALRGRPARRHLPQVRPDLQPGQRGHALHAEVRMPGLAGVDQLQRDVPRVVDRDRVPDAADRDLPTRPVARAEPTGRVDADHGPA